MSSKIKRKARHRYIYVLEFLDHTGKYLLVSKNAFLGQKDARDHGHEVLKGDKSGMRFMVHKLPLHSEKK